ncbi:MAG: DUF3618 domain-containing protein [Candidatus Eremiobacteraeota bacterium]|nr:DUF3618 domain-containing protein [Candidatus Eremiobacteraeota bacterium]
MGKETGELRQEIEQTRDRMGDTVDAIAYKADVPSRMHDALNDRVDSVKSAVSGTVQSVRQTLGGATNRVGQATNRAGAALPDTGDVRDATATTVRAIRENPLGLLFGSAAIGFLLGSLVPVTDVENERLGQFGDQIKQTAHDAGGQLLEQSKAVVRDTVEAAKNSAKEHGQDVARTVSQGISSSTP